MSNAILEISDLSFRYRLSKKEYSGIVLKNVNLTVEKGEILIFIGPSGSGKTTLLRLMNRLEDPHQGEIRFEGIHIMERDPLMLRKEIALVSQEPFLVEGTVESNLRLPLDGRNREDGVQEKMENILSSVGLSRHFISRSVHHLSLGEKQRICIARTLMVSPKVILMDEPVSALDMENRLLLSETIRRINRIEGITFVVVTHIEDFARNLQGRIFTMRHGEVTVP